LIFLGNDREFLADGERLDTKDKIGWEQIRGALEKVWGGKTKAEFRQGRRESSKGSQVAEK
jgi:hypothetical protein